LPSAPSKLSAKWQSTVTAGGRQRVESVLPVHYPPAAISVLPDLVLLDIGLPGMDGYELAQRLRDEPALLGVRLVARTCYGSQADRMRSLDAGFHDHLVKPVGFEAVCQVLEKTGPASGNSTGGSRGMHCKMHASIRLPGIGVACRVSSTLARSRPTATAFPRWESPVVTPQGRSNGRGRLLECFRRRGYP
jgi:CheY-like chemotaxis protein